jgi:hypothetical protein
MKPVPALKNVEEVEEDVDTRHRFSNTEISGINSDLLKIGCNLFLIPLE